MTGSFSVYENPGSERMQFLATQTLVPKHKVLIHKFSTFFEEKSLNKLQSFILRLDRYGHKKSYFYADFKHVNLT
jgi:hypothetical protein